MLLFTATALAGLNLGYPCSRLNWAWRNVWSTCSINSYIPTDTDETAANIPAHYRKAPVVVGDDLDWGAPTNIMSGTGGVMNPDATTKVPHMLCNALLSTGPGGAYGSLRNRCRRAIDAYGGLVRLCNLAPDVVTPGQFRGPVAGTDLTDWEPAAGHEPHTANVAALTEHARHCTESDYPLTFKSPSSTCPGLLGWFTVVWHACSFDSYSPAIVGAGSQPKLIPIGDHINPAMFWTNAGGLQTTPAVAGSPAFVFCNPITTATPNAWFQRDSTAVPNGAVRPFRTSRCRKALDQLGRTADRCGVQGIRAATHAPWTGWNDALLSFLAGNAGTEPMGFLHLAPLCN